MTIWTEATVPPALRQVTSGLIDVMDFRTMPDGAVDFAGLGWRILNGANATPAFVQSGRLVLKVGQTPPTGQWSYSYLRPGTYGPEVVADVMSETRANMAFWAGPVMVNTPAVGSRYGLQNWEVYNFTDNGTAINSTSEQWAQGGYYNGFGKTSTKSPLGTLVTQKLAVSQTEVRAHSYGQAFIVRPNNAPTYKSPSHVGFNTGGLGGTVLTERDIKIAQFAIYAGHSILCQGLPTGYKLQVDSQPAVVEVGGVATFDIGILSADFTTVKVLSPTDVQVAELSPTNKVWGGDLYELVGWTEVTPPATSWS